MTEDEVVAILQKHFESLFPRVCSNCGYSFASLRDYIEMTKSMGPPMSIDMELGRWEITQPIGTVVVSNCPCGSTMALSTVTMQPALRLELWKWVRSEIQRRGVTPRELLEHLRDQVRKKVLGAPSPIQGNP